GEVARQELPREGDRLGLEVVAEREVTEHLEERVVARCSSDVLEIVVLAARPHALLTGGGSLVLPSLLAEEDALELHHTGVGEQQRRVVTGHEGRGAHPGVPLALEVAEEGFAELCPCHRGVILSMSVDRGASPAPPGRRVRRCRRSSRAASDGRAAERPRAPAPRR